MMSPAGAEAVRLLFVCTGNMCRSAAADRFVSSWVSPAHVAVRSAGTRASDGRPLHFRTEAALDRHGIRSGDFRSRRLREEDVAWADLVLTMTAEHREQVLSVSPRGMHKTFTLLEAAALCAALTGRRSGGVPEPAGREIAGLLSETRRRYSRALSTDFDIVDPIDGPDELHEDVVDEIAGALELVTPHLGRPTEQTVRMPRLPPVPRPY